MRRSNKKTKSKLQEGGMSLKHAILQNQTAPPPQKKKRGNLQNFNRFFKKYKIFPCNVTGSTVSAPEKQGIEIKGKLPELALILMLRLLCSDGRVTVETNRRKPGFYL